MNILFCIRKFLEIIGGIYMGGADIVPLLMALKKLLNLSVSLSSL